VRPGKPKRIVYVTWNFPPYRGSGVANPLAAVNALARRGHEVTVLAAGPDVFQTVLGADWGLTRKIDPSVRVVRVDQPTGSGETIINRWPELRMRYGGSVPEWVRDITRRQFPEPISDFWYPDWLAPASAVARALHQREPFDLAIATVLPAVAAGVVLRLNVDTGLPFVLYERDSWVFSPFTGEPYEDAERTRPFLEYVFERAHQIWYVNTPLADLHRREFPDWADKVREVRNGWDLEFLPEGLLPPARAGRDGLVFRYVGTVYRDLPLELIAEGWRRARADNAVLSHSSLELVGRVDTAWQPRPDDGISLGRQVGRGGLTELYGQTDALVFIIHGGPMMTTGKVYEYAATGLPIVSVMVPEHDARRVLAGRRLWFDAEEMSPAALARAFVAAAGHQPTPAEAAAARQQAGRYRREAAFEVAFDQLEESLGW
jgi:hypothetical protein